MNWNLYAGKQAVPKGYCTDMLRHDTESAARSKRHARSLQPTKLLAKPKAITREEFARRRRQLMRLMGRDSIAIIPAAPVRHRNNDVEYPYRQDSDFQYLTGFGEPESVAVLVPGREHAQYVLFVRDRDPERETWDGRRAGTEGATRHYGADDAFPISDIDEILPGLMENRTRVFYAMGTHPEFDQRVVGWLNGLRTQARHGKHPPQEFVTLDYVLHDMRLTKSRAELDVMRESARIASGAHVRAMRACRPGGSEFGITAEILHEFRRHNADTSYEPIVGGGANSCILHYRENNQPLKGGDLLLIDAGCEYQYYASDITRTFPVNGRFSPEQRAVYDIVLAANEAAIQTVRPGASWNDPHQAAVHVVTQGLVKLGLLKGSVGKLTKEGAYRRFFMHRTGHWLGMDVHDVGDYKLADEWRVLEPGMALTIEPGIYIPAGLKGVPRRFANIGIRIEDDVVVTRDGVEVLTAGAPKDPDAIEALMAAA
jgi:Xaa-Pro aminopeptidase